MTHPNRDEAPEDDFGIPEPGFRWSPARALGMLAFALMAAFWIWAFIRGGGTPHPDELDLPRDSPEEIEAASPEQLSALRFRDASEAVCAIAQADIAALPSAAGVGSFDERADVIDQATDRLDQMVRDLNEVEKPLAENERDIAAAWLQDYAQFLQDREKYASTLRTGEDPPFTISARDGRRLTNYIVTYAEVNNMNSCVPPGDIG